MNFLGALIRKGLHATNFQNPFLRAFAAPVASAFLIQAAVGIPSTYLKTERFYDASGALTYLAVTWLSLYVPRLRAGAGDIKAVPSLRSAFGGGGGGGGGGLQGVNAFNWRQVLLSVAVSIWAARLGSFLYRRIAKDGHDSRFDDIRKDPVRFAGAWSAQAMWVSLCSAPVIAVNAIPPNVWAVLPRRMATDYVGLGLWLFGFTFEVVADRQKARWKREKEEKKHGEEFMTRGLWSTSQYPNYFGEATLWTGIATVAAGTLCTKAVSTGFGIGSLTALATAYVSPAFVTLLLTMVSGIPLSEKKYDARYGKREEYQRWKRETPKFFPKLPFGDAASSKKSK